MTRAELADRKEELRAEAMRLRRVDGLSQRKIAARLGVSEDYVWRLINRPVVRRPDRILIRVRRDRECGPLSAAELAERIANAHLYRSPVRGLECDGFRMPRTYKFHPPLKGRQV